MVVETLLVKVVNVVPTRTKMRTMTGDGRAPTTPIELPITFDSPDFYTYQRQHCHYQLICPGDIGTVTFNKPC